MTFWHKKSYFCVFSLLFLISGTAFADNSCDLFFSKGTLSDYKECEEYLKKEPSAQKYVSGLYTEGDIRLKHLLDGILAGNEQFISVAFLMRSYADGAMLEDIDIAIGSAFIQKTEYILTIFVKYKLNDSSIKNILLNTGENLVDDFQGQIDELNKRIAALDRISNKKLSDIKKRCKKIIEDEKDFLEKSMKEIIR